MAGFLVIAGLTGSIIVFNHELDEWLNPELFRVEWSGPARPALNLAAEIAPRFPGRYVAYLPLEAEANHAQVVGLRATPAADGTATDTNYYEVFVDPTSGAILGERTWGACCLSRRQLLPFLYSIHYTLHMPEVWGMRILGIVAIAWTLDCLVGFYLTLPARRRRTAQTASFWRRWKPSWYVEWRANRYRINFDLHRAFGLWLWIIFLSVAISGVALALRYEVFRPLVATITPLTPDPFEQLPPPAAATTDGDAVTYDTVLTTALRDGAARGWPAPYDMFHSPEFGIYGVGFGDHHAPGLGAPYLYYDATSGAVRNEIVPGQGTGGDILLQWMFPLHSGQAFGLKGRVLISLSGIALVIVTVTGVIIWSRKRRGRRVLAARATAAAALIHSGPPSRAPGR